MSLGSTIPVFRIFDEAKAKEFYVDFLGFSIVAEHRFGENFPLYMQVSRDGCVIHLSEHYGECCPGGAVRIDTKGLLAFSEELQKKDYKYAKPGLEKKELTITDPFGNKLVFTESVDADKT